MTSPRRRRINCNITRILSSDAPPATGRLYCSQKHSRNSGNTPPPLPRGRGVRHRAYYSTETLSKWCLPSGSTT
ncbi:hypothetical protein EAO18_20870 [Klebsiella pneumoniae]|nr:hypothetical protein EAO18_20870 [Klebsiella pneumoniae]